MVFMFSGFQNAPYLLKGKACQAFFSMKVFQTVAANKNFSSILRLVISGALAQ